MDKFSKLQYSLKTSLNLQFCTNKLSKDLKWKKISSRFEWLSQKYVLFDEINIDKRVKYRRNFFVKADWKQRDLKVFLKTFLGTTLLKTKIHSTFCLQ